MDGAAQDEPLWVFGYGSLVWRPGDLVHVDEVAPVCLHGFRRVFHQGSTDHRGVPGAPGRVVTLVEEASASTWGRALRLPPPGPQRDEALAYLEEREKQYDVRLRVDLFKPNDRATPVVERALVFVATPDTRNVNYLGAAPLEDIAQTIAHARGPSGPNWQYLYMLADGMRAWGVIDGELFQLEALVKEAQQHAPAPDGAIVESIADGTDVEAISSSERGHIQV
jgi:gamma-glutamylcyclotransferase, plant